MSGFRRLPNWIKVLYVIIALFSIFAGLNLTPILRIGGPGGVWLYIQPRFGGLLVSTIGLAIYGYGAFLLLKHPKKLLLWAFCGSVLLPVLLLTMQGSPLYLLFSRTASYLTGGYLYASTLAQGLPEAVRHWPDLVLRFREQVHTISGAGIDPPGWTMVFVALGGVLNRLPAVSSGLSALLRPLQCQDLVLNTWSDAQYAAAWMEMSMPFWAALAIVPLRQFGHIVFGDRTTRIALVFWPLIPGMALFVPRFNTFYPLIGLIVMLFLWRGVTHRRPLQIFIAGFITSVGTFLNLSLVPLGLLAGFWILALIWQSWLLRGMERQSATKLIRETVRALFLYGIGSALIWLLYGALSGVTVFDILRLSLSEHLSARLGDRTYLFWLLQNPYDMFLFLGFPLAALGIWRIFRAPRRESIADLFSLTFGTMFIILVFSILARGETGRVWIFLMPYWLLLASDVLAHLPSIEQNRIFPHLLLLQTICLIVPGGFFWSSFTALTEPARPAEAGNPAIPVNARFSNGTDTFTLTGLSYQVNAGKIQLRLVWRADTWIRNPIELSILPIADDGTIAGKLNYTPLDRQYPPACWTPGRPFEDIVLLPLERKSESWLYSISAWDINANKAFVVNGNQTQAGIGPIVMPKD